MHPLIPATVFLAVFGLSAQAQNWALGGHDPVGSMQAGHAVPGRGDISTMWQGESWHFASEENRARFEADPRAFVPAFGGLCPVALSNGQRVTGDPRHFAVLSGTLYLMHSAAAEQQFRRGPAAIVEAAREAWPRLK